MGKWQQRGMLSPRHIAWVARRAVSLVESIDAEWFLRYIKKLLY